MDKKGLAYTYLLHSDKNKLHAKYALFSET